MTKKKILIADDEEDLLLMANDVLGSDERYELFLARDGNEAIVMAYREKPDLVFLDVVMPEMNGWDVCSTLKWDEETANIKVVMLTALIQTSLKRKAATMGAEGFLTKPVRPHELREQVEYHLQPNVPSLLAVKTVLVADDEEDLLQLVSDSLSGDARYHVLTARDGEEALRMVRTEHPDLVLLDVIMPKKHGWEVCSAVKASPETRHIAVIMLSALAQESFVRKALDLGADDYLVKPIRPARLRLTVEQALHL